MTLPTSDRYGPATPSVSALIPAFRHEAFVGAALDGIAAQTLRPFETVVVDDGSPDGTAQVVADHPLPGIRLFRQENQGAHAALNRARSEAGGEWLAILNSDDVWEPEWIEQALAIARATGAGVVSGRVRWIGHGGAPLPEDHPAVTWYRESMAWARALPIQAVLRRHQIAVTTSNMLIHRSVWDRVGGFRAWRWVHDLDFLLRVVRDSPDRLAFVPEVTAVAYRLHDSNTIAEDTEATFAERARMIEALDAEPGRFGLFGWVRRIASRVRGNGDETRLPVPAPFTGLGTAHPRGSAGHVWIHADSLDAGGLEEVVAMQATNLQSAGYRVDVSTGVVGSVARRLLGAGIPVHSVSEASQIGSGAAGSGPPQVAITHASDVEAVESLRARGVPVIETIHNLYAWFRPSDWAAEGRKVQAGAHFIAVSEEAARYWRARTPGGAEARVYVVPNGTVADRMATPPRALARRWLDLAPAGPVIAHVGRIGLQKNQIAIARAFVEAAEGHPDAVLLLVGPDGGDGTLTALRRAFRSEIRAGRIRPIGSHPRPAEIFAAADATILWSLFEGWSLAVSEALWCGCPIVLGDTGGASRQLRLAGHAGMAIPHPRLDPFGIGPDDLRAEVHPDAQTAVVAALGRTLRGELPRVDEARLREIREELSEETHRRRTLQVVVEVIAG